MSAKKTKRYRLPRWPLLVDTYHCLLRGIPGLIIIALPIGYWKLLGVILLLWGLGVWYIFVMPKWRYVVYTDFDNLYIGNKAYPWSEITELKIDREGEHRVLQLSGRSGLLPYKLSIKDDILDFDELAQECFWHVNAPIEQVELNQK